jgi:hypothetical protein
MKVESLAKYISRTVRSKREPRAVGTAVIRELDLAALDAAGLERTRLTRLSGEELHAMWDQVQEREGYNPQPTPYVIVLCYHHILQAIGQHEAIRFEARADMFEAFDRNGQVVHLSDDIDFRRALYFIGLADEVIRPYISEFHWKESATEIGLNLNEEQIKEFQSAFKTAQTEDKARTLA